MATEFLTLPALKTKQREALIKKLAEAFGNQLDRKDAADPDAVYELLSQYSYHDRMTLVRETVRFQNPKQYEAIEYFGVVDNEYRNYRVFLCNKLTFDNTDKPTTPGFNRYLCLVADAPKSPVTDKNLTNEISEIVAQFSPGKPSDGSPNPAFWDGEGRTYKAFWDKFLEPKGMSDPKIAYQRLANVGVIVGAPPPRKPPLGNGRKPPTYTALPALKSKERDALVAQLAAQISKEPHCFKDPDAVFKTLGAYSYQNRLQLYKEALEKAGINEFERSSELRLRMSLVSRFVRVTGDDDLTFAGVMRYFALVADAPRNTAQNAMLRSEYKYIWTDFKRTAFKDKDDESVKKLYKAFFDPTDKDEIINGDPYTNLTYLGIKFGQPPQNQTVVPAKKVAQLDHNTLLPMLMPRRFLLDINPWQQLNLTIPSRETLVDTANELTTPESTFRPLGPTNPMAVV